MSRRIEELVESLILPSIPEECELVDVEFVKEGGIRYLRIYMDKEGGITLDDCKAISHRVSEIMDKEDPIEETYFLEVSSPGIDRQLKKDKDFEREKGKLVYVKLFKPQDGVKEFEGTLIGLEGDLVKVQQGDKVLEFSRKEIAIIRLEVKF